MSSVFVMWFRYLFSMDASNYESMGGAPPGRSRRTQSCFTISVIAAQVVAIAAVVIAGVWGAKYRGGYSWRVSPGPVSENWLLVCGLNRCLLWCLLLYITNESYRTLVNVFSTAIKNIIHVHVLYNVQRIVTHTCRSNVCNIILKGIWTE